jgi:hypothetical protein
MYEPETQRYSEASQYMMNQDVYLVDGSGTPIKKYTLFNAWPKALGTVSLDYASTDIATLDVTFAYQYYVVTDMSKDTDGTTNNLLKSVFNRITGAPR